MTETLTLDRSGPVLTITLNRPAAGNAINVAMARELMEVAIRCDEDPEIRAVVLTGHGRLFCAGGDVGDFAARGDKISGLLKELTAYLHMAISRFARMEKSLVTAINGPAAGAGLSLAVLGDIALAVDAAHFTLAYPALGLSPDGGSTWLLPRLVGLRRAQELILRNTRVGAAEAADIGLVTRLVPVETLQAEAHKIAEELARSSPPAVGLTRGLLLSSFGATLEDQMEREARAIAVAAKAPESRRSIKAFVERRR